MAKRSPPSPETMERIRVAMKILLIVVFLGTLFIWIMMPTNTYKKKWQPKIKSVTYNSTFFGSEGTNLLLYTFPVLVAASIGCIYLHLGKKINDLKPPSNGKKNDIALWKKPVLVRGPLGIVSGIELAFFVMFIALLIWSFATYLYNSFKAITPSTAAKKGEEVWQSRLSISGLRLGLVGNIGLVFLFFPVARGSSVLQLFGLTSENSIKYHIWVGHIVMSIFTAHGLCYIIYWASTNQISQMLQWDQHDVSNLAGEIALLSGLAMWATTFPSIRRKMFELFYYTHHLYILFLVFFIFHVGISYACIMLPGFYLYMVDRYLRFLQSKQNVRLISARVLQCEAMELNFSKSSGLNYKPTSVIFINVPSISKLQWHPFTVTSNSSLEPERLSVIIKGDGKWTKKLYQILVSPDTVDRLGVSIEGPYGPASTNFLSYDNLVMVSGGSGITPIISILREMIFISKTYKCKTPNVTLLCAFKNSPELTMLDLLFPICGTPSELSNLQVKIEAYVTREKQPTDAGNSKLIRTIWFKPLQKDAPISPILGPNGWLWLGAIISCSFIIFLVLIGVITRCYIFPIDHNTNEIFSYITRSAINIVAICFSVAMTASASVLWNKKRNANETKQVQNLEGPSPTVSPNSWFYNPERDVESLPDHSLVQATIVHYGERPDLKKILSECKGSNVRVLVSGPKSMREDVATICSSGIADNLSFESISFSW